MKTPKEKYLFLYLNTGAGHVSSAKTIANYLNTNYKSELETVLINGFEEINPIVKFVIEDGYRISQAKAKWIFEGLYALNKIDAMARSSVNWVSFFVKKYLTKVILQHQPSKIIVFHFFMTKPVWDIVKKLNSKIDVITVATDPFTAPKIWFTQKNANYVVFSQRAKTESALKMGVETGSVKVLPFIINQKFNKKPTSYEVLKLKQKWGYDINRKLTVIIGGGDGMPRAEKIVSTLINKKTNTQIAVVCGRNKQLFNNLTTYKSQQNAENLTIYGFIDFVYELLAISDFVITKGGPSLIMEVLALNKIPIINTYIWEQEKGNMEFVRDNHLGFYEPNIHLLPQLMDSLIYNELKIKTIENNIQSMQLTNGTKALGEYIYQYSQEDCNRNVAQLT